MIKIYSEKEVKPDVYLSLKETPEGVVLLAVDSDGKRIRALLTISKGGYLVLHQSADVDGIITDCHGRICIQ